jgi:non-specific serine/threonine protein kinase
VLWDSTGGSIAAIFPQLVGEHDTCVAAARAALGDKRYEAAFRAGRQMSPAQALGQAEHTRRSTKSGQVGTGAAALTTREQEIAMLLAQGLSNKAIAKTLVIAQRTAETHVANIMAKLGLTSRSQVAAWLAEHRDARAPTAAAGTDS